MEKILGYSVLVILAALMVFGWRSRNSAPALSRLLLMIVGVQIVVHLVRLARLAWLIEHKFGYYSLPPKNQFLLTEAISGIQPIFVGAIHAALWLLILWYVFLRRGQSAMLDIVDIRLLVLGLVAVGWPAGLVFLAGTFIFAVLGMLVLVALRKKNLNDRLLITPYIIPAAVLTLLVGYKVLSWTHLDKIRF